MRLLVHVAGEADLLLDSQDPRSSKVARVEQVRRRRTEIEALLDGPEGAGAVRRMLINETPQAGSASIPGTSPVLGALDTLATRPDLTVVILGTSQSQPGPLDTLPIAQTLANVLNGIGSADRSYPVRQATVLSVAGLAEAFVIDALTEYLGKMPQYEQALVTWGSGATMLTLGALTALSRAGLPWQLVLTSDPTAYQVVDPLEQLDIDPVAGVFIRWRMFATLDDLDRTGQLVVQLSDAQRDLVRQAAKRRRDGLEAADCASVRAVLADAVVRRDGTASLAVRRYITSRYEDLLRNDQNLYPEAKDLLHKYEKPGGGPPLGGKLSRIREAVGCDPVVDEAVGLSSYKWLFSDEVATLQRIGIGSHNLCPPSPNDARLIGDYLSRYIEETSWRLAELPEPPVTPADTTLVVWPAGTASHPGVRSVGEQVADGLPTTITDFLGVEQARVHAVIFGVDDGEGSRECAEQDAALIRGFPDKDANTGDGEAWVELIDPNPDPAAIEQAIERRLTRETGALLLVPTGKKPIVLALLGAMRRVGARNGLPLFVRQNATPKSGNVYAAVHLWPALTEGDRPLLNAAKGALRALELDVAWRLLAASAIDPAVTNQARQLADTFASRRSPTGVLEKSGVDQETWTTKLITQRLEVVEAALAHAAAPADRIRLLVLAADAVEASIAAVQTQKRRRPIAGRDDVTRRRQNGNFGKFKNQLRDEVERAGEPEVGSAQILLLLNQARNRAPITHGTTNDPDAVVREAVGHQAKKGLLSATDLAPRDLATLLRRSVAAAAERGFGDPGRADSLLRLQEKIIGDIGQALAQRDAMPNRVPSARTAPTAEGGAPSPNPVHHCPDLP
ncbi:hypothetical protein [Salinispora tropica]|nr:hypothetical protein [Salinispora tropica]